MSKHLQLTLIIVTMVQLAACATPPLRQTPPARISAASRTNFTADLVALFPGLDSNDVRRAAEAQTVSLEFARPGQPTPWRNPDSGNYGEVIAGPGAVPPIAGSCRTFKHTIYVRGQGKTHALSACRDGAGTWSRRA